MSKVGKSVNPWEWRRVTSSIFVFGLAILFAMLWGPGSCNKTDKLKPKDYAASVNGHQIPLHEFSQQYQGQLDGLRRQGVPAELARQFGMHKQILDQLVNTELLSQAAEARGLNVSDAEVLKLLMKDPSFQQNGAFDKERYLQIVSDYMHLTPPEYEDKLRRRLAAQRMLELVESSVVVSDEEVKARYLKEGNAAKATFVRFTPAMYAEKVATPKPPELEAFAKAHEVEIAEYYAKNKSTWFRPEQVKARQILLRVAKEDGDAKKADAATKIENLRKDIVDKKKNFAEVAKQFSEDTETREKGGDLGFVERLQLPGNFADVLFALKPGEVSVPVESPLGFHLGIIEDRKAPEQKPLEGAVRTEIAAQLLMRSKAKEIAKTEAEKALAELKKNGKKLLDAYPASTTETANPFGAKAETKPEAKETGEFNSSADSVPQLGRAPELFKTIFDRTSAGLVDQVVALEDSYVIVSVDERRTPGDADFATRKEQLKLEAIKGKQYEVKDAFLKALKQGGQVTTNDKAIDKIVGAGAEG